VVSECSYVASLLSCIREKVGCAKDVSEEGRNGELPLLLLGSIKYVWYHSGLAQLKASMQLYASCSYHFTPLKSAINLVKQVGISL